MGVPTLVRYLRKKRVLQVACGWNHTLILVDPNTVYSCGLNRHGQLGLCDFESRLEFTHLESLKGKNVTKVFAGGDHSWFLVDSRQPEIDIAEPSDLDFSDAESGERPEPPRPRRPAQDLESPVPRSRSRSVLDDDEIFARPQTRARAHSREAAWKPRARPPGSASELIERPPLSRPTVSGQSDVRNRPIKSGSLRRLDPPAAYGRPPPDLSPHRPFDVDKDFRDFIEEREHQPAGPRRPVNPLESPTSSIPTQKPLTLIRTPRCPEDPDYLSIPARVKRSNPPRPRRVARVPFGPPDRRFLRDRRFPPDQKTPETLGIPERTGTPRPRETPGTPRPLRAPRTPESPRTLETLGTQRLQRTQESQGTQRTQGIPRTKETIPTPIVLIYLDCLSATTTPAFPPPLRCLPRPPSATRGTQRIRGGFRPAASVRRTLRTLQTLRTLRTLRTRGPSLE